MVKLYIPIFSLTLLLSAALLFSVQPMFAKMLLPLLGGTSSVWTTAMLFFQLTLLAGYAYAHGMARFFPVWLQSTIHVSLLIVFFFFLPFSISENSSPPSNQNPTLWQLTTMLFIVGGPFFVLSASAPLLQKWFSYSKHSDAKNPYFLYGASNLGSMASLLCYPFLIEPLFSLGNQSELWRSGYALLAIFTAFSAILILKERSTPSEPKETPKSNERPSFKDRAYWLLLAFLPSSLMLGATTYITTDIASAPFLWIMPLALYVGTFIIVFSKHQLLSKDFISILQGICFAFLIVTVIAKITIHPFFFIGLHLITFFTCALYCHKELADKRPSANYLTEFYLIMSFGGALGGIFNSIIAPQLFFIPIEYSIILIAIAYLRVHERHTEILNIFTTTLKESVKKRSLDDILTLPVIASALLIFSAILSLNIMITSLSFLGILLFVALWISRTRLALFSALFITLLINPPGYNWNVLDGGKVIQLHRNFYGVLRVTEHEHKTVLLNGTTNHGSQPNTKEHQLVPIAYYSEHSPFNDFFEMLSHSKGSKIAVVGLGVGVMSCLARQDQSIDYFEINPAVVEIAENKDLFTYLSGCKSTHQIFLGDGRLKLANRPNNFYDGILLDAFSSDNIPIHLLTTQAIKIYEQKLKSDGVLAFHISNKYLDLEPILAAGAQETGFKSISKVTLGEKLKDLEIYSYPTHASIFVKSQEKVEFFKQRQWKNSKHFDKTVPWSDDYSNILSAIGTRTLDEHLEKLEKKRAIEKENLVVKVKELIEQE